jgi:CHASE2 domain
MLIVLRLKVQQVQQSCFFELTWGQEQRRDATLEFPATLTDCYENWQWAYLGYYKNMPAASDPSDDSIAQPLRGRSISGSVGAIDWHGRLVRAEAELMSEFHQWLGRGELLKIRTEIARAGRQAAEQSVSEKGSGRASGPASGAQVFLTCNPLALSRFPWEAWEIGAEFGVSGIRFVRTPSNIHQELFTASRRQGKPRVLLILGDDTGLNFKADRLAVQAIDRLAEVKFVGWQQGQNSLEVKTAILQAIADQQGWDILLFAGHSNESQTGGGELGIAPGVSMYISEIEAHLKLARDRGLQFALFNSCQGLNIAESLIDRVGLSQVAILREPIHNRVAQEFLAEFLQNLARYSDVQESLLAACQMLKLNKIHTYPSAYLIPSLFCHPSATPFRLSPPHWKRWMPGLPQAIALTLCLLLSVLPPAQGLLLDQRLAAQAIYRSLLGQVPPIGEVGTQSSVSTQVPPVALIQVDDQSVKDIETRLKKPAQPMPTEYLAELVDALTRRNPQLRIIGIDYLFKPEDANPGDAVLAEKIRAAVEQQTWFVFGTLYQALNPDEQKVYETDGVFTASQRHLAQPGWSLQGYAEFSSPYHLTLPYPDEDCRQTCPFAYLLTIVHAANPTSTGLPKLQLRAQADLRAEWMAAIDRYSTPQLQFLRKLRFHPLSTWMYDNWGIVMLEPIVDYSIPPNRIYDRIAARRLREDPALKLRSADQIVLIGSGAYAEAGHVIQEQADYHPLPLALRFWQSQLRRDNSAAVFPLGITRNEPDYLDHLTGSEVHAYMIYQFLNQRIVVPVPSLWLTLVAPPLGLATAWQFQRQKRSHQRRWRYTVGLGIAVLIYGILGLQAYISAGVLLPWLLPSTLFLAYILPILWRKNV